MADYGVAGLENPDFPHCEKGLLLPTSSKYKIRNTSFVSHVRFLFLFIFYNNIIFIKHTLLTGNR
jgi:hypothetical protein